MIYERAVPVSSERHKGWSVRTGVDFSFAKNVNSVPLLAAEFIAACQDYAVVFAGDANTVFPSVILGMRDSENSHVDEKGSWTGSYIPAFLRRYPFVFASSDDNQTFTLCLDEEFEGFNKDGKGERMFDADGNRTQFLESQLAFAQEYQALFQRTQLFCKRLKEHDLLEPAQAQFNLADGEKAQLSGFFTISREKLKALPAETLAEMAKTDELELCYVHLNSLNNLTPMARRAAADQAAKDEMPAGDSAAKEKSKAEK